MFVHDHLSRPPSHLSSTRTDWYRPPRTVVCVTGRQVLHPTASSSASAATGLPATARCRDDDNDDGGFTPGPTVDQQRINTSVWHLNTDRRRVSRDHSKLILLPTELSTNLDDVMFSSRETTDVDTGRRRLRASLDRKRCRRSARVLSVDELRVDDRRRGRFKTLLLDVGRQTLSLCPSVQQQPIGYRSPAKSISTPTVSYPTARRPRRGRTSAKNRRSQLSDKPEMEDTGREPTSSEPDDGCEECEAVLSDQYGDLGDLDTLMSLVSSRQISVDLSILPDHDCSIRQALEKLTNAFDASENSSIHQHQMADEAGSIDVDKDNDEEDSMENDIKSTVDNEGDVASPDQNPNDENFDNDDVPTDCQQANVTSSEPSKQNVDSKSQIDGEVYDESKTTSSYDQESSSFIENIQDGDGDITMTNDVNSKPESRFKWQNATSSGHDSNQVSATASRKRSPKPKRGPKPTDVIRRVAGRTKSGSSQQIDNNQDTQTIQLDDEVGDNDDTHASGEEIENEEEMSQLVIECPPLPEFHGASRPSTGRRSSTFSPAVVHQRQLRSLIDLTNAVKVKPRHKFSQISTSVPHSKFGYYSYPTLNEDMSRTVKKNGNHFLSAAYLPSTNAGRINRSFELDIGRFDLPVNLTKLADMVPAEYLRHHCYLPSGDNNIYQMIHRKHCNRLTNKLQVSELHEALRDVIPIEFTPVDVAQLCSITGIQPIDDIDIKLFIGFVALAARLQKRGTDFNVKSIHVNAASTARSSAVRADGPSQNALRRNSFVVLEHVDLSFQRRKLKGVKVNAALKQIIDIVTPS